MHALITGGAGFLGRKLAAALSLADVDELETQLTRRWGAPTDAGRNLLDRQRLRIRAERLGVESVTLSGGRITFQGLAPHREAAAELKEARAVVYPKSRKVTYPFRRTDAGLVQVALGVLELCGGDDEDDV